MLRSDILKCLSDQNENIPFIFSQLMKEFPKFNQILDYLKLTDKFGNTLGMKIFSAYQGNEELRLPFLQLLETCINQETTDKEVIFQSLDMTNLFGLKFYHHLLACDNKTFTFTQFYFDFLLKMLDHGLSGEKIYNHLTHKSNDHQQSGFIALYMQRLKQHPAPQPHIDYLIEAFLTLHHKGFTPEKIRMLIAAIPPDQLQILPAKTLLVLLNQGLILDKNYAHLSHVKYNLLQYIYTLSTSEQLCLLKKALQKEHTLGKLFWLKNKWLEPNLNRGSLKEIQAAIKNLEISVLHHKGNYPNLIELSLFQKNRSTAVPFKHDVSPLKPNSQVFSLNTL